jgi:hypothetical protein
LVADELIVGDGDDERVDEGLIGGH